MQEIREKEDNDNKNNQLKANQFKEIIWKFTFSPHDTILQIKRF